MSPGTEEEDVCGEDELPLLSTLLFGETVSRRSEEKGDESVEDLVRCVKMCVETTRRRMGDTCAMQNSAMEWENVTKTVNPRCLRGAHALRAGLLLFLHREPAVAFHFARKEPGLVEDLKERVLPLIMPRFLANMAQSPDVLVTSVTMLCLMWDGVPIGEARDEEERRGGDARAEILSDPA